MICGEITFKMSVLFQRIFFPHKSNDLNRVKCNTMRTKKWPRVFLLLFEINQSNALKNAQSLKSERRLFLLFYYADQQPIYQIPNQIVSEALRH